MKPALLTMVMAFMVMEDIIMARVVVTLTESLQAQDQFANSVGNMNMFCLNVGKHMMSTPLLPQVYQRYKVFEMMIMILITLRKCDSSNGPAKSNLLIP